MKDEKELIDLLEDIEDIGLESREGFILFGHRVRDEHKEIILVYPSKTEISVIRSFDNWEEYGTHTDQLAKEYISYTTEPQTLKRTFRDQFWEFWEHIESKFPGIIYAELDQPSLQKIGCPSGPAFAIYGSVSQIIKLKPIVLDRFAGSYIGDIPTKLENKNTL